MGIATGISLAYALDLLKHAYGSEEFERPRKVLSPPTLGSRGRGEGYHDYIDANTHGERDYWGVQQFWFDQELAAVGLIRGGVAVHLSSQEAAELYNLHRQIVSNNPSTARNPGENLTREVIWQGIDMRFIGIGLGTTWQEVLVPARSSLARELDRNSRTGIHRVLAERSRLLYTWFEVSYAVPDPAKRSQVEVGSN